VYFSKLKFLKAYKICGSDNEKLLSWINLKMGPNELRAIHIAGFKGNSYAIKKLSEYGVDLLAKSKIGLNILHCAAQNDKPWPIAYCYHEKGAQIIDEKDYDGNTALHWACKFGFSTVSSYLLKWSKCINEKNNSGETPLHLAVSAALASGSTRLPRLLCFSGADRNILDNNGRKAIDYLSEENNNYSQETIRELKNILKEPNECMCLMVRIPLKKNEKNPYLVIWYFIFRIIQFAITVLFAVPRIPMILGVKENSRIFEGIIMYGILSIFLFSSVLYLISALMNPGTHIKDKRKKLTEFIEKLDEDVFCPFCEIVRSQTTRHCVICNKCCERYDHHCPWINNCVGIKNHNYFLTLVLTLFIEFGITTGMCSFTGAVLIFGNKTVDELCQLDTIMYDPLCELLPPEFKIPIGLLLGLLTLALLFCLLFSGILSFLHTTNYLLGKTTNARFGAGGFAEDNDYEDKGCIKNCKHFCSERKISTQQDLFNKYKKREQINNDDSLYTEENVMPTHRNLTKNHNS